MADLPEGVAVEVRGLGDAIYVHLDVEGTTFELHPRDARRIGVAVVAASYKAEDELRRINQASEIPQEAMKRGEGVLRHVEPMQAPTPGSFAGLENREEVIAKPRTSPK